MSEFLHDLRYRMKDVSASVHEHRARALLIAAGVIATISVMAIGVSLVGGGDGSPRPSPAFEYAGQVKGIIEADHRFHGLSVDTRGDQIVIEGEIEPAWLDELHAELEPLTSGGARIDLSAIEDQ